MISTIFLGFKYFSPMFYAMQMAASFPDGNINPWSKSHSEISSPTSRHAEVPPITAAIFDTVYIYYSGIIPFNYIYSKAMRIVMIFVSEAICLLSLILFL